MPLQHTGLMFVSKGKTETSNEGGEFVLTVRLLDVLGQHSKELYVVVYRGPAAQAFWEAHQTDLTPGAIVDVHLTHVRAHAGYTRPPMPVLHARATRMAFCPKRTPDEREQATNQEQSASVAA
ncbi:MAG: hypothetical protein EOP24_26635 [Hyphomicrobiales bacterium]|nr:MAG: hypothetical protein EOP24_26635 [Hyphomicrobiales bacterium]